MRALETALRRSPRRPGAGSATANASTSSRVKPSSVAIRSAEIPWGTVGIQCPQVRVVAVDRRARPPSTPQRDIDSTPPATTRSWAPLPTPMAATVIGLLPRAAEPVERHAGHGLGPAGQQHGQAGDVVAVVPAENPVAGDHVVDLGRVEADPRRHRPEALGEQLLGVDPVERAVGPSLARGVRTASTIHASATISSPR